MNKKELSALNKRKAIKRWDTATPEQKAKQAEIMRRVATERWEKVRAEKALKAS